VQPRKGLLAGGGLHEARSGPFLRPGLPEAEAIREGPTALSGALSGRPERTMFHPERDPTRNAVRHADQGREAREGDHELRPRARTPPSAPACAAAPPPASPPPTPRS